ncbi:MerC domain-containing protein [Chitinophaga rhizophila]|uniref:MerC domain-containing protein n=1 Tax=Chitinophaga rhizophila TaxID=2866212 RepID=A0ABS7G7K8_9BACT|nr:MerC domain-containing protein [Chitinophaga rhizophila]MBW8683120.1 MerC domain-containing protein [Chitinophaga rhizophila]
MDKLRTSNREAGQAYEMKWDAIGIGASLACAIHCILLPVIFTTLTLFDIDILENVYLEVLTVFVSMSIGGWAIWRGYKRLHGQKSVLFYFAAGLLLMIAGNFIHGSVIEMGLKFGGAALLITAHIKNWKSCRGCEVHTSNAQTPSSIAA